MAIPISEATVEVDLDCSGLLCPLPVYQASVALRSLDPGQVLRLTTTDPGALEDIPAMTRQRGDVLLAAERGEGRQMFLIEKGGRQ